MGYKFCTIRFKDRSGLGSGSIYSHFWTIIYLGLWHFVKNYLDHDPLPPLGTWLWAWVSNHWLTIFWRNFFLFVYHRHYLTHCTTLKKCFSFGNDNTANKGEHDPPFHKKMTWLELSQMDISLSSWLFLGVHAWYLSRVV
jgi:hypothetical protein